MDKLEGCLLNTWFPRLIEASMMSKTTTTTTTTRTMTTFWYCMCTETAILHLSPTFPTVKRFFGGGIASRGEIVPLLLWSIVVRFYFLTHSLTTRRERESERENWKRTGRRLWYFLWHSGRMYRSIRRWIAILVKIFLTFAYTCIKRFEFRYFKNDPNGHRPPMMRFVK